MTEMYPPWPDRNLRERAEEALRALPEEKKGVPKGDLQCLIHELQVHEVELEMQNDELRKAFQSLEESRDRYFDLYDFAPVGYFTMGEDGLIIDLNYTGAELLGFTRSFLIGRRFSVLVAKESRDALLVHRKSVFETGVQQPCEVVCVKKDGGTFHAHLESVAVEDANGRRTKCRTAMTDVSRLKQVEEELRRYRDRLEEEVAARTAELGAANEALRREIEERERASQAQRESEARWRSLVGGATDTIIAVDRTGTIQFINRPPEGVAAEEVVGRSAFEYFGAEHRDALREAVARAFETRQPDSIDIVTRSSGSIVSWLTTRIAPVVESGKVTAATLVTRDYTEAKRLEEERGRIEAQFRKTQKLEWLSVMAGSLAHDFDDVLQAISGNAALALADAAPGSLSRQCLEEIERTGSSAADLVRQLLACSVRDVSQASAIELSEVVRESRQALEAAVAGRATIQYQLAPERLAVWADVSQVRLAITNVVANAAEAMGEDRGIITVATGKSESLRREASDVRAEGVDQKGPFVYVEVRDTGRGIDEATRARMFEPFFTTKPEGRGLGLSAVAGIVRSHKGAVEVEAEPSKGTRVRILLPAADEPTVPTHTGDEPVAAALGKGTVLVVDDKESVLRVGKLQLTGMGFTVLTASDGLAAVEVFRKHAKRIRVVLLDLTTPVMDGLETFRELHKIRDDVPVILTSGYTDQEVAGRFSGEGFAGFLQKPYRVAELQRKLQEVLRPE